MALVASTTFAGAGTHTCAIPAGGRNGSYMILYVVANQGPTVAAPTGWALEQSIRATAPTMRTFSRVRQAGDTDVTFTTTAEGTAMVLDFGAPLANLTEIGGGTPPADPFTIFHADTDPGSHITLVHWTTHTGYTDTAGDYAQLAIEPRAGLTLSVYEAHRLPGADLTGTFEDTVGTYWASVGYVYDFGNGWHVGMVHWPA